jgi:hypothetical protein
MRIRKRGLWAAGVAAAGVIGLVVAGTGNALAATALPDKTVLTGSVATTYTFSTTSTAWSVVAMQPGAGANYDLRLSKADGTALDKSALGTGKTDFVAINSHTGKQPVGDYRARVSLASGAGSFAVQLRRTPKTITLPIPAWDGVSGPSDPDITFATLADADVVNLYEIKLNAGDRFWASSTSAAGRLNLLESISDPTTWIQTRAEASTANARVVDNCTLFTASMSNSHALVVVDDRSPSNPGGGIGFALHRFDPNRPLTCPIRNFPAPTPA